MVEERVTDGTRIARLLSSEVSGREDPPLDALAVANANPDVEGTPDGEPAFEVHRGDEVLATVLVHGDRARVELTRGLDAAERAASEADLRVRPKATRPPRLLVFVESGGEVKRAVDALAAAVEASEGDR